MPNETVYFGRRLESFCLEFLWPMGCRRRTVPQSPLKKWVKENSYLVHVALLPRDSVRRSSLWSSAIRDRRTQSQPHLIDYSSVYVVGDNFLFIKHYNLTSYDSGLTSRSSGIRDRSGGPLLDALFQLFPDRQSRLLYESIRSGSSDHRNH